MFFFKKKKENIFFSIKKFTEINLQKLQKYFKRKIPALKIEEKFLY